MINTYTLFTSEVDLLDATIADINKQLAEIPLQKNSVGILICHYDFVEYGIVSALRESLPFPLVGITTFYQTTPKTSGLFELTITILTSDDVRFALACSAAADEHISPKEKIQDTYRNAFDIYGTSPALVLSFISANRPVSGDEYLRHLDDISGGIPSFGVVNSGEDETGANIYIISEGHSFSDGIAMLLLIGELHAKMYTSQPLEDRLLSISAAVTSADGVIIKEINQQSAATYLKKNGVNFDDINEGIVTSVPFYCRMPGDEKFVCRLLKSILPNGALEFMAEIPEGTQLRIGTVTADDILEESCDVLQKAVNENPDASIFFIASCVGRFITLGLDTTAEMDHVAKTLQADKNHLACYVGGEICPIQKNGQWVNRYHNNSFIVLALH